MQELTRAIITTAAQAAGLPEGRVMNLSASDNLTIPRPRIELQWLPETYTRLPRKLGHLWPGADRKTRLLRRELYQVKLEVSANILAEDPAWLSAFSAALIAELPNGVNNAAGNWVLIAAQRGEWLNQPEKRVGLDAIKVFERAALVLIISFVWRITRDELQRMITDITLKHKTTK